MEFVTRFVRLAARYEEETYGSTKISFPSSNFSPGTPNSQPQLGSGMIFVDEATYMRELSANASRIEGWRKTNSYQYCLAVCCCVLTAFFFVFWRLPDTRILFRPIQDYAKYQSNKAIKGVDVLHQLVRLRHTKNIPDNEVELIMLAIAQNLQSYEQVVEVSHMS
jgi:hypothetical protein